MSMIFLSLLLVSSEITITFYLYYLHSLLVWRALRKYHSKSYIKKSRKKVSLFRRFSGEYIEYDVCRNQRWLKPSIRIVNLNFFSIVIVVIALILTLISILSFDLFNRICVTLYIKDVALVIYFIVLYKCFKIS